MAGRKSDFTLPTNTLDELFSTQEERDDAKLSKIRDIPLELIDDFPDHPFKVRDDEDMIQLVESVKERGVITPATVRQKEDGRYELISGHRRKRACELAGFEALRCEVVDLDRDAATVLMVESNYQRSQILPSEKAFAYKMRLDALSRQGKRTDLTSDPVGGKWDGKETAQMIGEQSGDSQTQVRRYIRLTNLVPELLDLVDEGKIKMRPAVELSYLNEVNQRAVVDEIDLNQCTPSHDQTIRMRKFFTDGKLNNYTGEVPTLQDFRAELLKQSEPEAQEIALAIELFTNGSLNTFAKKTNVNTDNRLICYDILDLGKQLMPIGMLVVLDSILNRITQNRAKGKNTFIFIDEIYLLFQHEYSANFLFTLWKRVRKYGAYATGITQNVDDLLQSHTARTMLANSEFIVMLNQASTDRLELAKLLNISDTQLSYITNVDAGHGLIKVGSSLVPFANKFPKNTKLYKLMTTKPGEGA